MVILWTAAKFSFLCQLGDLRARRVKQLVLIKVHVNSLETKQQSQYYDKEAHPNFRRYITDVSDVLRNYNI